MILIKFGEAEFQLCRVNFFYTSSGGGGSNFAAFLGEKISVNHWGWDTPQID